MKRLMLSAALGAMVWAFAPPGALAQATSAPTLLASSDDIHAGDVKPRGDGSVDDDQPNADDSVSDDDIGDDGPKHRGDGSIDDDQTRDDNRGRDHARGRDHELENRDDDHRGSDHERGRDRDRDIERNENRGHG